MSTFIVEYTCWHGDPKTGWHFSWQDEAASPRAWGFCPECGKRRSPVSARTAGEG